PSDHPLNALDLVLVDDVVHVRVEDRVDLRAKTDQALRRLEHTFLRDVEVDVAASEEDGGAGERTVRGPRRPGRPDETAAEAGHAAESRRMPDDVLERQTGTLRKPAEQDFRAVDARGFDLRDQIADDP